MSVRAIHRALAWVAGLVAVLWAATGFLHPVMSWTAPRPAVQAPPVAAVSVSGLKAPTALPSYARMVRLVEFEGRRYWQVTATSGEIDAIDAESQTSATDVIERRAIALARHYAGLSEEVAAAAEKVERFSTNYPSVNKLLPVWEVRFDTPDGLTLYVEPGADRLAMTTNDQRRVMLALFQNIHTLKFLEGVEPLRLALTAALVGSVLVTTLLGMAMLVRARGRGVRLWHRTLAWVAAPLTILFTASGVFHLVATTSLVEPPSPTAPSFATSVIASLPRLGGVERAEISIGAGDRGAPLWRVAPEGVDGAIYFDAQGRALALDDAQRARQIAGAPEAAPTSVVPRFSADYGFVNKRLPVVRVGEGGGAVFVDLREGLVAARAPSGLRASEAWFFDVVHKWEPLADMIGRRNRDYLSMIAVALIFVMSSLGLMLAARRKRKGSER